MPNHFILEICLESVEYAIATERGGADRIELCSDLPLGGITPSAGLMRTVRRNVSLPIHVLIRPRAGDFCYSDHEVEIMRSDIQAAKQSGMDGIVLGILHDNSQVDIERTAKLVELAHPLPVTFHRAFDVTEDLDAALDQVIRTGATRLLTSGGATSVVEGLPTLTRLVQLAGGRILVMPCGRVRADNIVEVVRSTKAQEFHTSAGTSCAGTDGHGADSSRLPSHLFEEKVSGLVRLLGGVSDTGSVAF